MKSSSVLVLLGIIGLLALLLSKKTVANQYAYPAEQETEPPPMRLKVYPATAYPQTEPPPVRFKVYPAEQENKVLYQNEERISLVRDADGHIAEFVIHRKVTADG